LSPRTGISARTTRENTRSSTYQEAGGEELTRCWDLTGAISRGRSEANARCATHRRSISHSPLTSLMTIARCGLCVPERERNETKAFMPCSSTLSSRFFDHVAGVLRNASVVKVRHQLLWTSRHIAGSLSPSEPDKTTTADWSSRRQIPPRRGVQVPPEKP
jgi:hypothetical protein